uniref:Uncharacterized protein n=1 Tax=Calidris pygmaea TaxID=425635 RepID=A0A8C3KQ18_9CHAR
MERMIIFCMLFLCSSMALTAAPYRIVKYKQLLKTIRQLEPTVKDKVRKNAATFVLKLFLPFLGILKLQPANSQVNSTFSQTTKPVSQLHCESSCESYEKKNPKEFLKSFEKLIKKVELIPPGCFLTFCKQTITDILILHYF